MGRPLYVETLVHAELDLVWHRTQDAAAHTRWDLRFGLIEDEAPPDGRGRAFRYSHGLGRFRVAGTGTTVGERSRPDGTRTSALRFASAHPLSPIRRGHGWWRYVPTPDGVRFLTGYDYTPSWGRPGALLDRLLVRPAMGRATAWSFDRLRLWCERGTPPELALVSALVDVAVRGGVVAAAVARAARSPTPGRLALVGVAVAGAALVPHPPTVPRASRCRRAPHDETGRAAPTTLRTLQEPT